MSLRNLCVFEDRVPPALPAIQVARHVFVCRGFFFIESGRPIPRIVQVSGSFLSARLAGSSKDGPVSCVGL